MRTLLTLIIVLALLAGGIAAYLAVTTPDESKGVTFPLTADQRALLARVPASADAFALIPTAGPLQKKLRANPVTRDPFEQWASTQEIPGPWILGGADIVAWRDGKQTSYAIRVDALRAFLVRTWMMWAGDQEARWDGTAFVINGHTGPRLDAATLDPMLELAKGLPPGDVFAVQRSRERGMFPPIGRPAVSSVKITPEDIVIVARADAGALAAVADPNRTASLPVGALLAVNFTQPPRLLGDLERFTGTDVSGLVAGGGSIAIYDVDTGTLLPRPKGIVSVPADDRRRAAMGDLNRMAQLVGETRDTGQELLVSFDRTSLSTYLKDTKAPVAWPANQWAARLDPQKMVPVLEKLGDSTGLRLASGRLHRAARDLRRWIKTLENAKSVEAAASVAGATEELRVRIASK
jgi:hypothetical protein